MRRAGHVPHIQSVSTSYAVSAASCRTYMGTAQFCIQIEHPIYLAFSLLLLLLLCGSRTRLLPSQNGLMRIAVSLLLVAMAAEAMKSLVRWRG